MMLRCWLRRPGCHCTHVLSDGLPYVFSAHAHVYMCVRMQEQEELAGAGYDAEVLVEAAQVSLEGITSTLNRLPPMDWVQDQVRVVKTTQGLGTAARHVPQQCCTIRAANSVTEVSP